MWGIQISKNENEILPKVITLRALIDKRGGGGIGNKQEVWNLPKYLINGREWNKRVGWNFSKYLINGEEKRIGWNLNNLAKIGSV